MADGTATIVAPSSKWDTSPIQDMTMPPPSASSQRGADMDMWDRLLSQEKGSSSHAASVTPTTAGSPSAAGFGATANSSKPTFKPMRGTNPADVGTNPLEMLTAAMRSSPNVLRQVKFEIARLVLARSGSTARPTEEEANHIVELLARELGPMNSVTPPDGRATIDTELQWSSAKDAGPAAEAFAVPRPNAPVNDAPQVVQDVPISAATLEAGIRSNARVYGSDTSSNSTVTLCPKPVFPSAVVKKTTLDAIRRKGGLRRGDGTNSAFSERSDGSHGSHTGSNVSKENRGQ